VYLEKCECVLGHGVEKTDGEKTDGENSKAAAAADLKQLAAHRNRHHVPQRREDRRGDTLSTGAQVC